MGNVVPLDFQKQAALLDGLGVLDYEGLRRIADVAVPWAIDGLMTERSVNILAGDSGIGKTPLATMAAIHKAAGLPFLGHATRQGPVLYCAGEGDVTQFSQMIQVLSETAGLDRPPPDFRVWGPFWSLNPGDSAGFDPIVKRARILRPTLIVVDTLRIFIPQIEEKASEAARWIKRMRELSAEVGCIWLLIHHRRKPSDERYVDLAADPDQWFHDIAGSSALVTQTDLRLGMDLCRRIPKKADLILAGRVRGSGLIPVHYVVREYGEDNEPRGYQILAGRNRLDAGEQVAFDALPEQFTRTQLAERIGGQSDSNVARYINDFKAAGLITQPVRRGPYLKVRGVPGDER